MKRIPRINKNAKSPLTDSNRRPLLTIGLRIGGAGGCAADEVNAVGGFEREGVGGAG